MTDTSRPLKMKTVYYRPSICITVYINLVAAHRSVHSKIFCDVIWWRHHIKMKCILFQYSVNKWFYGSYWLNDARKDIFNCYITVEIDTEMLKYLKCQFFIRFALTVIACVLACAWITITSVGAHNAGLSARTSTITAAGYTLAQLKI